LTPNSTIYEQSGARTSNNTGGSSILIRCLAGFALGGLIWLVVSALGLPNVAHLDEMIGLIPFALTGLALNLTRARSVLIATAAGSLLALVVIAFTPFAVAGVHSLIRSDPLPAHADAVVVLSAGVTTDGYLHEEGLDRLLKGLSLVKRGIAPTLVVTREERHLGNIVVTTAADQDSITALADVTNVIATPVAASTHDEATDVKHIADRSGWKRIIVVTSPFHTRRACATFEHVGLTVSCIPSDSRDVSVRNLVGPRERAGAFGLWVYELAATLQYRRRGWM
jgi:uncharacterized SAM-binding protein YcdF (DUF218 family)